VDEEEKSNDLDAEVDNLKVDSYKIQSITTMLDDFENIIAKNFC